MGFTTPGSGNPYAKLDERSVVGIFKSAGSRDADVLHARKTAMQSRAKQLRWLGIASVVIGVLSSLTLLLAVVGIPLAIFGAWTWRRASQNLATIEAAWGRFSAQPAPEPG